MSKNIPDVELLTMSALADKLGMQYDSLRARLSGKDLSTLEYKGYRFVGRPNKVWYAYDPKRVRLTITDHP